MNQTPSSELHVKPIPTTGVLVGLDIGGTKTEALVVDHGLNRLAQLVRPTDVSAPSALVSGVAATLDETLAQSGRPIADIMAIGIAVPGLVEPDSGLVRHAVNLNLVSYPLGPALSDRFGAPGFLENDVGAGALGAYRYARRHIDVASLAYLSIGTGINAGLILDGRLYRGVTGMAGEIGHVIIEPGGYRCSCGMPGCLEAVSAGPAVARLASETMAATPSGPPLTARDVYAAASRGDHHARRVVAHVSRYHARAVQLLIMAYDVEKVVLGGGVSRAGQAFMEPLLGALAELRAQSGLAQTMLAPEKILLLPPGYSAGAWGAIALAQQGLSGSPGYAALGVNDELAGGRWTDE